jgi:uncharacterized protein
MPSLYAVAVPVFVRGLHNLDHLLAKAQGSEIAEKYLLAARVAADMFPLVKQVQIACDTAKFAAMRVGGAAPLPMADDEASLQDLRGRVQRTIGYLNGVDPAGFEGREAARVMLKLPDREMTFTGLSYITDFALPNFFFHVTTAYALLRQQGVPIGKRDYLAGGAAD